MTAQADAVTWPDSVDLLLQRMVQFDTVNAHVSGKPAPEAPLADYLQALAEDAFFQTRRLPVPGAADNLLILHQVHRDRPWLLFDSHLDTVGVAGMTIDPFAGRIEGDRLYGRGACDTKGTGAAMLWALREYVDKPPQPNNIALLFSVDEEITMAGIRAFCGGNLGSLGFTPAGAVVGEPTRMQPVIAHNGVMRMTIATHGVAAHSAAPQLGQSAISMMAKVIARLEQDYIAALTAAHPLTGQAVCSINVIRGGVQANIIPEHCEIEIDRRTLPGEDPAQIQADVQHVLDGLAASNPGLRATLKVGGLWPSFEQAVEAPFLQQLQQTLADQGASAQPIGAPFATHAGDLAKAGIPAVVLGPGDYLPAHTKDEYVELPLIRQGAKLYKAIMKTDLT